MQLTILHKGYFFKLVTGDIITSRCYSGTKLYIYDTGNNLLKTYNVEYHHEYFFKILKTKVKSNDILKIFDTYNNEPSLSKLFFNKLLEVL